MIQCGHPDSHKWTPVKPSDQKHQRGLWGCHVAQLAATKPSNTRTWDVQKDVPSYLRVPFDVPFLSKGKSAWLFKLLGFRALQWINT